MKPAPQRRQPAGAGTATLAFGAVISLGAVGVALWTQHARDMQPCAWCVLQRLIFVAIALAALPGLLWRRRAVQARLSSDGTLRDAAVRLWGLSYEFWSLGLFMLLSALALRRLLRKSG